MDIENKLDKILNKLEENEKRLHALEKIAEEEGKEIIAEKALLHKEVSAPKELVKEESALKKQNSLFKVENRILASIIGIVIISGVVLWLVFGPYNILNLSKPITPVTSADFFQGPIGQSASSSIDVFSNLSAQLQSVGEQQLSGNVQCFASQTTQQGPLPGYCVLVMPDNNYDVIPLRVPSNASVPHLESNGKVGLVYIGAQGCPFCAQQRYVFIATLSRFGNFSQLFYDRSATNDYNIPTFTFNFSDSVYSKSVSISPVYQNGQAVAPGGDQVATGLFTGAYYTSNYINFEPFDEAGSSFFMNSTGLPLVIQSEVLSFATKSLAGKYDGFGINNFQFGGVPFMDINNQYVFDGATVNPNQAFSIYDTSSATQQQMLASMQNPAQGSWGESVLGATNILTAQICSLINNSAPVCSLSYISALETKLSNSTY